MNIVDIKKLAAKRKGKNRRRGFFFSYADIAKLTGHTPASLKTLVARGKFNPKNLESLLRFTMSHWLMKQEPKQEKIIPSSN